MLLSAAIQVCGLYGKDCGSNMRGEEVRIVRLLVVVLISAALGTGYLSMELPLGLVI